MAAGTEPTPGVPPVIVPRRDANPAWLPWLLAAVAAGALWVLRAQEPHGQSYYPRCLLHAMTGLQCPGCGGLRATHALLNGEFAASWRLNPLPILLAPVAAWTGIVLLARRAGRRWPNPFAVPWMIGAMAGATLVFGVLRNLPAFRP